MGRVIGWSMVGAGLALAVSLIYWQQVPDPMPTHWGPGGLPDGWSSRTVGLLIMPGMIAVLGVLLPLLMTTDRRCLSPNNQRATGIILGAMVLMLGILHLLMIQAALTPGHRLADATVVALLGLLFLAMAAAMPLTEPNRYMGIRTRSTRDPGIWRRTHQFAGWTMGAAGLLTVLCSVLPGEAKYPLVLTAILAGAIAPAPYAWWLARAAGERA